MADEDILQEETATEEAPEEENPTPESAETEPLQQQNTYPGLRPALREAIIDVESGGNPQAVSSAGAFGKMQVMPDMWQQYGGGNANDPEEQVRVGSAIYMDELARFRGNEDLALAAYNAGSPAVIKAMRYAGYDLKDSPYVKFEDIKEFLPEETKTYPSKVHAAENNIGRISENDVIDGDPTAGTKDYFWQEFSNAIDDPNFDNLSAREQIDELNKVIQSKQYWTDEAKATIKKAASAIWDSALPQEKIRLGELIARPPLISGDDKTIKNTLKNWQDNEEESLLKKGTNPLLLGEDLDKYFKEIENDQIASAHYRQRGALGTVAAVAGNIIASPVQGFVRGATDIGAFASDLLGAEGAKEWFEKLPESIVPSPARDQRFAVNEDGRIVTDRFGRPITRMRYSVTQGLGQLASVLIPGGIVKKVTGSGAKALALIGGLNTMQIANSAYNEAVAEGGDRNQALLSMAFSVPSSALMSFGDLLVLGEGDVFIKGLSRFNQAKVMAGVIGEKAFAGGTSVGLQVAMQEAGTSLALGRNIVSAQNIKEGILTGAALGGIVGPFTQTYKERPVVPAPVKPAAQPGTTVETRGLPAPAERLGLPAPETRAELPPGEERLALSGPRFVPGAETTKPIIIPERATPNEELAVTRKLEAFQRSTGETLELTADEAKALPPGFDTLFHLEITQEGDKTVLTKREEYIQRDAETLENVNSLITNITDDLKNSPSPDNLHNLVQERRNLVKEREAIRKERNTKVKESGDKMVEAVKQRQQLQKALDLAKAEKEKQTDPVLRRVAQLEENEISQKLQNFDEANSDTYDSWQIIGDLQERVDTLTKQIKDALRPAFVNDLKAKERNLQNLLKKKNNLESRIQSDVQAERTANAQARSEAYAKTREAEEGRLTALQDMGVDASAKTDLSNGVLIDGHPVFNIRNKWYVVDPEHGNAISKGFDFVSDAADFIKRKNEFLTGGETTSSLLKEYPPDRTALTPEMLKMLENEAAAEKAAQARTQKIIEETRKKAEEYRAKIYAKEVKAAVKQAKKEISIRRGKLKKAGKPMPEEEVTTVTAKRLPGEEGTYPEKEIVPREEAKPVTEKTLEGTITEEQQAALKATPYSLTRRYITPNKKPLTSNYTRLIQFAQDNGKMVRAREIYELGGKLLKSFNRYLKVFPGSRVDKGVLAFYDSYRNYIVTGRHNDVMSFLHELKHAVDRFLIGKWDSQGFGDYSKLSHEQVAAAKDMADTFYALDGLSENTKIKEGLALFFEHYSTGQPVRKELLNWYHTDFAKEYPEVYNKLEALKNFAFDFFNQRPNLYIQSLLEQKGSQVVPKRTEAEAFKEDWINQKIFFRDLAERAGQEREGSLVQAEFTYSKKAGETLLYWIKSGLTDLLGNHIEGLSLKQIMQIAGKKKEHLWEQYATAKRLLAIYMSGKEAGANVEDLKNTIEDIQTNHGDVVQSVEQYYKFLDFKDSVIAASSPEAAYTIAKRRKANKKLYGVEHGYYVPMQVAGEESFKPGAKIKGTTQSRVSPLENVADAISYDLERAYDWMIRRRILETYNTGAPSEIGAYMREVTGKDRIGLLETYKKQVDELYGREATPDEQLDYVYSAKVLDGITSPEFKVIPFRDSMDIRLFEMNPRFMEAVSPRLPDIMNTPAVKYFLRPGAAILRPFATTFRGAFQIKNFMLRDWPTAEEKILTEGGGWKEALSLVPNMIISFIDLPAYKLGLSPHGLSALLDRAGLLHMTRFSPRHELKTQLQKQFGKHFLDMGEATYYEIETALSIPELATREAYIRSMKDKIGLSGDWKNQKLTPELLEKLTWHFANSTCDFSTQGRKAKLVNLWTPFFTARIAEHARLVPMIKRNAKFWIPYAIGMFTYGLYKGINDKNDPDVRELEPTSKLSSTWFKVNVNGVDKLFYFPLTAGGSVVYGLGYAIGLKAAADPEMPAGYYELAKSFLTQHAPISSFADLLGPWGREIAAQWGNKDLYYDRAIEPPNLQYQDYRLRYNEYTSELAKKVGMELNVSPLRIDHAIRNTAPAIADFLSFADKSLGYKQAPEYGGLNFVTSAMSRSGAAQGIKDRSQRIFTEYLLTSRYNMPAETPQEKNIRQNLERINSSISDYNALLSVKTSPEDQELRTMYKNKQRELLHEGIKIAEGLSKRQIGPSPIKGQADIVRRQKKIKFQKELQAQKQEFFSLGALTGETPAE